MKSFVRRAALLSSFFLAVACSDAADPNSSSDSGSSSSKPPTGPKVAYAKDPATQGKIRVTVELDGQAPEPEAIRVTADNQVCKEALFVERWVVASGKVANCLVSIEEGLANYTYPEPAEPVSLDQKTCRYRPHVLGLRTGQLLRVLNSDPTLHNVLATPRKNPAFNEGMAPKAEPLELRFQEPERIKIKCSVHTWMEAWVHVLTHPFFATTGDDGTALLEDVPAGEYVVQVWHEAHQKEPSRQKVVVKAGETSELTVKLVPR